MRSSTAISIPSSTPGFGPSSPAPARRPHECGRAGRGDPRGGRRGDQRQPRRLHVGPARGGLRQQGRDLPLHSAGLGAVRLHGRRGARPPAGRGVRARARRHHPVAVDGAPPGCARRVRREDSGARTRAPARLRRAGGRPARAGGGGRAEHWWIGARRRTSRAGGRRQRRRRLRTLQPRRGDRGRSRRAGVAVAHRAGARLVGGCGVSALPRRGPGEHGRRQGARVPGVARMRTRGVTEVGAAARTVLTLLVLPVLWGCARVSSVAGLTPPDIDPGATFAAYRTHDGLTIARAPGGATGTVDAAGWSDMAPSFRVEVGGRTVARLRVPSTAQVDIDAGGVRGQVQPSWDDGAIRLTIRSTTGETLRTRTFRAIETTSGLSLLTRNAQTTLDMRGTYRSDLRDASDQVVGWLQVHVWEPSGRHVYEAVFPEGFPTADAAAAALALDSEVAWIRRFVLDVNRGTFSSPGNQR